jgi:hypothetical protein
MYIIDWGAGGINETECYPVGMEVEVCHTYAEPGTYVIRVKAIECPDGLVGPEGTLTVIITKDKNRVINTPFLNFLQSHPYLFPILKILLLRLGLQ